MPTAGSVASRRESRLRIAIGLNLVIVAVQVVFGIAAHSLGLLADAGHNLTDVAAVVASLIAVRLARREPTASRSFGYHRGTILAAQLNAATILAITVPIAWEAVRRLLNPQPVSGAVVVVVAAGAFVANLAAALLLREHGHGHGHDLNMRSAVLHMAGDAVASLGVAVAAAVILFSGRFYWLDPAVSLGIAALIAAQALKLLRDTTDVLLESTPAGLDADELGAAMVEVDGVEGVHDLHAWSLSSEVRALSAHLVLSGHPSLKEAQVVGERVKRAIRSRFAIAHATLELECDSCADEGPWCAMEGSNRAAPAHPPGHAH